MGAIQQSVNQIEKGIVSLASENAIETQELKKQELSYKKDVLKLKQDKLNAKRAAFEKSLERRKHAMERVSKAKKVNEEVSSYTQSLLAEAKKKREARTKING